MFSLFVLANSTFGFLKKHYLREKSFYKILKLFMISRKLSIFILLAHKIATFVVVVIKTADYLDEIRPERDAPVGECPPWGSS